jgi:hypothetical protein
VQNDENSQILMLTQNEKQQRKQANNED